MPLKRYAPFPTDIVEAADGSYYVSDAEAFNGAGGIIHIDPTTGAQTVISSGGHFVEPSGLTIDSGGDLIVVDRDAFSTGPGDPGGGVIRVDPVSGVQTKIASGSHLSPNTVSGIAVGENDAIFVTGFSGTSVGVVIQVDPLSGAQTVVSSDGSLRIPVGVVVDANSNLLVADFGAAGSGAVLHIDPLTGAQTVVSPVLIAGMSIDETTGLITWTPAITQTGNHDVTVRAEDTGRLFDTQSFPITVQSPATNTPPIAVAGLLGDPNLPQCVPLPPGLVSWYPGDGNSMDITGPNSPTSTFGSPQFVTGKVGQGISFDGVSGLIVPNNPTIDFTGADSFTIDFWVRVEGVTGVSDNEIIDKFSNLPLLQGYQMSALLPPFSPSGTAKFNMTIVESYGQIDAQVTTRAVPLNEFHHITGVVDRAKQTISIHLNGVLEEELSIAHVGEIASGAQLSIGHHNVSPQSPLVGTVDELEIFNRALSPEEIQTIFLAGNSGKCKFRIGETVSLNGSASSDPDGDPLTYLWELIAVPNGSTATLDNPTSVNPSFVVDLPGTYIFQIVVNDGLTDSTPATASLAVLDANRPPFALEDSYTVDDGGTLTIDPLGVLANDVDIDGDGLTATLLDLPPNGTLDFQSDGAFTYTPDAGVHGPDQTAHAVIATVHPSGAPGAIAVNATTNQAYVPNAFTNDVTVIDGTTNTITAVILPRTSYLEDVAVNSITNRIYVSGTRLSNHAANSPPNSNRVTVIDGETNTILASIPVGSQPDDLAINAVTNQIYVANVDDNTVSVIDGLTNTVVATVPVGRAPPQIGLNSFTNRIYVLSTEDSTVSVINGATNAAVATISVGNEPQFLAVDPDLNRVYTANFADNTVSVIDGASNTIIDTITVGTGPQGIGLNPTTGFIYVSNFTDDTVSVIDETTLQGVDSIPVGMGPQTITVNPFSNRISVINFDDNSVSVINGATNAVTATVPVGAEPVAIDVNPETARVYTANFGAHTVSVIHVGDHFTYKVNDGELDSNIGKVTVVIERDFGLTVLVPNVVGLAQADAEAAIITANLTVGTISTANSDTVPAGHVISQNPVAGTVVVAGALVDLVVSLGPDTGTEVTVPAVVGLVQAAAEAAIIAANLTVGTITTTNSDTVPAGQVISQNPAAGTEVASQTAVNLVVSLGPAVLDVAVPDVVGLPQADAETAIAAANLLVGTVEQAKNVELSFDTLPSVQGWLYGALGNNATETEVFSIAGGVLYQNTIGLGTADEGYNRYDFALDNGIDPTLPFTLTFTARVLQEQRTDNEIFGFVAAVVLGTERFFVGLGENRIDAQFTEEFGTTIDTSVFHEYRLEATPGGSFDLFVDDILFGRGTPFLGPVSPNGFVLGDASGSTNAEAEVSSFSFVQGRGLVFDQDPDAGTLAPEGSDVDLLIVEERSDVMVPNVVGQQQDAAIATIVAADLSVGTITKEHSDTVPVGSVSGQDPLADSVIPEKSAVKLVVSLGPAPVTVPNVVGFTQAEAEAALLAANLTVGTITSEINNTIPVGRVLSQTPEADSVVEAGSAVNLIVALHDSDGDGIEDGADLCPDTPDGEPVDANGCSESQLDDDADGVFNSDDLCPDTLDGEPVDANGCSESQLTEPASIALFLTSNVALAGSAVTIQTTVRNVAGDVINPSSPIDITIVPLDEPLGPTPIFLSDVITIDSNTRGNFEIQGRLSTPALSTRETITVIAPAEQNQQLVSLSQVMNEGIQALDRAQETFEANDLTGLSAAKTTIESAIAKLDFDLLRFTSLLAPEDGFPLSLEELVAAGFPPTSVDESYGNVLDALLSAYSSLIETLENIDPENMTDAQTADLNVQADHLGTLIAQFELITPTVYGVAAHINKLNGLINLRIPKLLQLVGQQAIAAIETVAVAKVDAPSTAGTATFVQHLLIMLSPASAHAQLLLDVLAALGVRGTLFKLTVKVYGPVMKDLENIIILMGIRSLLTNILPSTGLCGALSSGPIGIIRPEISPSQLEGLQFHPDPGLNFTVFIGPEIPAAIADLIKAFNPKNWSNASKDRKNLEDKLKALGDAGVRAIRLPDSFRQELSSGCPEFLGEKVDVLVYDDGFPDVLGECFVCLSPIVIFHYALDVGGSVFTIDMVRPQQ